MTLATIEKNDVETPMERLEAEIREDAAHLDAATCRWLLKVAEFDGGSGGRSGRCAVRRTG